MNQDDPDFIGPRLPTREDNDMKTNAIPAKRAGIHWNRGDADGYRVRDVAVVDRADSRAVGESLAMRNCDGGACWADWLDADASGDARHPTTPEGVFGSLCGYGFSDPGEMCRALVEFARIEGADWARRMLDGLEASNR